MNTKEKTGHILLLLILILTAAVYFQVRNLQFTNYDTPTFIINNPFLNKLNFSNILKIFTPGAIHREVLFIPVTYFSFLIETSIFSLNSAVFHLDNLIIHLLNTVLVYFFIFNIFNINNRKFFRANNADNENKTLLSRTIKTALISALLFALHPLQTESISWIMGRKDLLAAFFSLCSLLLFVKFLQKNQSFKKHESPALSGKKIIAYFISITICFTLACLSKPSAVILPLIFLLILLYFNCYSNFLNKSIVYLTAFVSLITVLLNSSFFINAACNTFRSFHFLRILSLPVIVLGWLKRVFLLSRPDVLYTWNNIQQLTVNTYKTFFLFIILIIIILYCINKRNNIKGFLFWLTFSIICLTPSLKVFFTYKYFFIADRYSYFALLGIFTFIGYLFNSRPLYDNNFTSANFRKILKYFILFGTLLYMVSISYSQVQVWSSSETLWKYILSKRPSTPYALNNMATFFYENNKRETALKLLLRSYNIRPIPQNCFNIAEIYRRNNNLKKSVPYYREAIELSPENVDYHGILGTVYLKLNKLEPALTEFKTSSKLDPENPRSYLFQYKIYLKMGKKKKAGELLKKYRRINTISKN
ncbi:MAG: tetratricopeptide repeat protein [Victivallales bacterium]|nr:tetratricopeptide repeat protein [Victivallales bacterium]MCF7889046.1 tetratricopeptide repeat protein [Victivallales bacterium]